MKTFIIIIIIIVLVIIYLIFRDPKDQSGVTYQIIEKPHEPLAEGYRTIEEIMLNRPSNEVLAELTDKKFEGLTENEMLVFNALTKWYDDNPSYKTK